MSDINPGDVVTVRSEPPFKNAAGAPADPTTVRLLWRRRGHPPTVLTYGVGGTIVRDGPGVYHADILITKPGKHYVRWEGTGDVTAAEEAVFEVGGKFA